MDACLRTVKTTLFPVPGRETVRLHRLLVALSIVHILTALGMVAASITCLMTLSGRQVEGQTSAVLITSTLTGILGKLTGLIALGRISQPQHRPLRVGHAVAALVAVTFSVTTFVLYGIGTAGLGAYAEDAGPETVDLFSFGNVTAACNGALVVLSAVNVLCHVISFGSWCYHYYETYRLAQVSSNIIMDEENNIQKIQEPDSGKDTDESVSNSVVNDKLMAILMENDEDVKNCGEQSESGEKTHSKTEHPASD
jgi:hypothetical protein